MRGSMSACWVAPMASAELRRSPWRRGGADGGAEEGDFSAHRFVRFVIARGFEQAVPGFVPTAVAGGAREQPIEAALLGDIVEMAAKEGGGRSVRRRRSFILRVMGE